VMYNLFRVMIHLTRDSNYFRSLYVKVLSQMPGAMCRYELGLRHVKAHERQSIPKV
jgi:hypothetical protein